MSFKPYLQTSQKTVFQILKNSFSNNKTSHAYIVSGSKGSPILETAIFMAQSLVCLDKDENHLACEECINCKKIQNNTYVDFKLIRGEDLKTDVVLSVQEDFNKSTIENENVQIYIIHLIEKAPISSLNKLLKFIEEPNSNIVAIFTSNSVSSVLQTIVSRCQIINLKEFMIKDLVAYLKDNDVADDDAYLISKISNNAEENLNILKTDDYKEVKSMLQQSLNYLANKDDYFIVDFQTNFIKKLNDNSLVELYLDMLEVCLLEAIIKKEDNNHKSMFFDNEITNISANYKNIAHMIEEITRAKIDLLSNANNNLVFDRLLINLLRS